MIERLKYFIDNKLYENATVLCRIMRHYGSDKGMWFDGCENPNLSW